MEQKGVFDQSLEEMLEFDAGLDVNAMLDSVPPLKTEPQEDEVVEEKKSDKKDVSLKNINKVLEEQSTELEKETKKVDEETEEIIKKSKKSEKVEKTEETDDKASASLEQSTEKTSDAPFTVIFARDLVAQGLLSSFDEEKFNEDSKELGDAEALRNLIKSEIDANIEAAKSDLDLGYKEYLSLVGKGVPQETAGSLIELKNRFSTIKTEELLKEENTELRKQIISDYYKLTTSMPEAKINKLVQSSVDLGDDIEDSKEYLTKLNELVDEQIQEEKAEADKQRKLADDENKRSIETLKENINSLAEIVPGMPINKQTKVQMFEAITKPVQDDKGRTTNSIWAKRAEDPMFFDERLSYLYVTGFFEKGKLWNKVASAKVTKNISELEDALAKKKNTFGSVGSPVLRNPEIDKTARDNIDSMRGIFGT